MTVAAECLPQAGQVGWLADGRAAPRSVAARPSAPRPGVRPHETRCDLTPFGRVVARLVEGSLPTTAGRFFHPTWVGSRRLPAAPPGVFTVHLSAGAVAFRLLNRSVSVPFLAAVIRACPEWHGRPLLLVLHPRPSCDRLTGLVGTLAAELRVPVYVADAGVWQMHGAAFTGGTFRRWAAVPDPEDEHATSAAVGPWMPANPCAARDDAGAGRTPVPFTGPAASLLPDVARLPVATRWSPPAGSGTAARVTGQATPATGNRPGVVASPSAGSVSGQALRDREDSPVVPVASDGTGGNPRQGSEAVGKAVGKAVGWVQVRPRATAQDRERMRRILGWRFEAHARAVLSMLALQPGLRLGTSSDDLLAGLVAVRAFLAETGESPVTAALVDAALRSGLADGEDRLGMMARCVCAGLARLPAVVGPVFGPAAVGAEIVGRYRPGDLLVEPAFLEVSTTPWQPPASAVEVEYVIWSSTARRIDPLGLDQASGALRPPGRALFAAGTRFTVLAVDHSESAAGTSLVRVLLRETVGGRVDGVTDGRVLERLRERLRAARANTPAAPRGGAAGAGTPPGGRGLAVGHADDARPFAVDGGRRVDELELAATA